MLEEGGGRLKQGAPLGSPAYRKDHKQQRRRPSVPRLDDGNQGEGSSLTDETTTTPAIAA